jgi:hypothetical protein
MLYYCLIMHRKIHNWVIVLCAAMMISAAHAQNDAAAGQRLLIIAPESFKPALIDFVKFKMQRFKTSFVSLEDALKQGAGDDDAERLKRFLYVQWRTQTLSHVLLVGDVDVMPVRYMVLDRVTPAAFDYAFYASDLYYGDLAKPNKSFDDWNAARHDFHRHYIGEVRGEKNKADPVNFDQVDYQPEIAVGRWPVSSPEEVKIVAAKSMAYELALEKDEKPGANTAAFLANAGWVDGRGLFDALTVKLPKPWKVEKRYYADDGRNDQTPAPDSKQAIELLNSGVALMVHIGHGDNNRWDGSLSLNDLASIDNADRLPIMMSAGCGTAVCTAQAPYEGYVDSDGAEHNGTNNGEVFAAPPPPPACYQRGEHNTTSLGEQLLRGGPNGAVAYIGCNTGGQPCALTLIEGFVNAIAESQHPRLGDCWNAAVKHYYVKENLATIKSDDGWYPPSVFYQPMKYMVFGDPTLPIGSAHQEQGFTK